MKKSVFLIIIMCLTAFSFTLSAQNKKDKNSKDEVVFDVSMTCDNCKKKIEKNIPFEKGVSDLKVDLPSKTVTIVYKTDKTNQEKLQSALEKMGYDVNIHTSQESQQ